MIDDISQFFEIVFLFFIFSLFLIGIPTVILKLILSLFIQQTDPRSRRMIAGRSLAAALISGLIAIGVYFAVTMGKGVVPLSRGHWIPGELGAGLTLIILVFGLDIWIWVKARVDNSFARTAIWLGGSNIWIVWAFVVMSAYGSYELSRPCYDYPGQVEALGVDAYACAADARSYWALHPELWESARDAAGH
ncbi:hypothetical protein [Dongia sp.]|uniref:hypothetical protein n=1 Tax=Dongia sp. TaxID=1977262 RepID=UPI0035B1E6DF